MKKELKKVQLEIEDIKKDLSRLRSEADGIKTEMAKPYRTDWRVYSSY
ncbi:hypothetical protein ACE1TF_01370 [Geomicrobium sp. JSM 1781026]|nr:MULTISPECIES: hypothetical protein [unclassified Geomicrobium]